MSAPRPELRALASRLGVLASYRDTEGKERETQDATYERLVRALGHEAGDEASARRVREALEAADRARLLEPTLVYREWVAAPTVAVNGRALRGAREYALVLQREDGTTSRSEGRIEGDGPAQQPLQLALPAPLACGYHEVALEVGGEGGVRRAAQRFILAPRRAFQPDEALGADRAFGILANLYSLRGTGFGHGHFGDLAALARFAGQQRADFVGTNPLHAVPNEGLDFSPYSPTSRLYRNALYLDPEAVPELSTCEAARRLLDEPALRARRDALQRADRIDHEAVLRALEPVLRALHAGFRAGADAARAAAYADYCRREGAALDDFATFEVLCHVLAAPGAPPLRAWWRWPEVYRDARGAAVAALAKEHEVEVDFQRWLQFELDRQLGLAARAARDAGCRLGLYPDLALGAARASADTWMEPRVFAHGASIGAPPDDYALEGQDWGLPPLHPQRLREDGYRFFARVLRAGFAHAGALRLDHAMSLVRLFWIPDGRPGSEGAYVAYRPDELLGVLALESRRARALVVAEDLGTLPAGLPGLLADWGLLRSAVTRFEREADGRYRPARAYPANALASLGTHDLPPLPGFLDGTDLALRRSAGAIASDAALAAARAEREGEVRAFRARLAEDGLLADAARATEDEISVAAHAFLAGTPSRLVAASLDDLAGEREPVNLPGVAPEQHRSWSRRMAQPLASLLRSPELAGRLAPLRARARREPAAR